MGVLLTERVTGKEHRVAKATSGLQTLRSGGVDAGASRDVGFGPLSHRGRDALRQQALQWQRRFSALDPLLLGRGAGPQLPGRGGRDRGSLGPNMLAPRWAPGPTLGLSQGEK